MESAADLQRKDRRFFDRPGRRFLDYQLFDRFIDNDDLVDRGPAEKTGKIAIDAGARRL